MPPLNMRPGALIKTFALTAAAAALIVVALAEGRGKPPAPTPAATTAASGEDPLHRTLTRCNTLGTAAADDPACKAVWEQQRARFFATPAAQPQFKRPSQWVQVARPGAQT